MAIQIYCDRKLGGGRLCKTSNALTAKRCSGCGIEFGRESKYRVCVSLKGKRVNRIVKNLTIARETEATIQADMLRGEYDITHHKVKSVPKLDDVWKRFLEWAKVNKEKSWMTDEFFYRKHLAPRFGSKPLDGISSFELERMKAEMKKQTTPQGKLGYSDATIRHVLVLLGHLFKKARVWKIYSGENPVASVKKPKLDNKVTEFLTAEEMERLLKVLAEWPCRETASFVLVGLFTGLRKSEIRKLRWEHIDLERKTLTIVDPKGKETTTIPISEQAIAVFSDIPVNSEYVLPGPDGKMKRTFRDPWYRIRETAGLPANIRFHGTRHNFASWLVSSGVDLYTVSKLLNHKDVKTSTRYSHLSDEALRRAANVAGNVLVGTAHTENHAVPIAKGRK
jgi:integrase